MFLNKANGGSRNNICGVKIARLRKEMKLSQRELAELLNENGMIIDKNAVQRIEAGLRFVVDTELQTLAATLNTTIADLLSADDT